MDNMLFSYGTLQFANVQKDLFGRIVDMKDDVLEGYKVSKIKIRDSKVITKSGTDIHPILVFSGDKNDIVKGKVLNLTKQDIIECDNYEVSDYTRKKVTLKSGKNAWIYTS